MSKSLYIEALSAAEEIKNAAEEKAKKNLIEALSPQIKLMVENSLMETDDEYGNETDSSQSDQSDENPDEENKNDNETQDKGNPRTSKQTPVTSSTNESQDYQMSSEAQSIFSKIINKNAKKEATLQKISEIKKGILTLKKATLMLESSRKNKNSISRINLIYKKLVKETKNISRLDIIKSDKTLQKEYYNIIKELSNMSRRRSRNSKYLNETLEDLLEMNLFEEDGDDDDASDASDDNDPGTDIFGPEDESGEGDDLEGMEDMEMESDAGGQVSAETTVEELAQMAGLLETEDESADEGETGEEPEELDLESFFESDKNPDEDPQEGYEGHEGLGSSKEESFYESSNREGDLFLEIDENMLRREISKMKRLREGEAKQMASHFGGGSLEGEMFVDGVELNKLHEMKIKAAKVVRMNRMLESKLSQYKKALRGMKGQLAEMNLFNAKLLYANKLMQNRDLSIKQQRHIVESLDEAKTLGEAKILFESLTKSLARPVNTRNRNLSEGAVRRPMSSSSRPVRSGQAKPLNESVALDRWATLAGIK